MVLSLVKNPVGLEKELPECLALRRESLMETESSFLAVACGECFGREHALGTRDLVAFCLAVTIGVKAAS